MPAGTGAGVAGAVTDAATAPGEPSHDARIRNCSLSRPRVTGDENSTRSRRGEFSRSGMRAAAAEAWPVSSTPFVSAESSVSHASFGRSSVSSRSRGSGRTLLFSRDWIEASNRRRSEEHTSELQSLAYLVCRLLLEKKKLVRGENTNPNHSTHAHGRRSDKH